MSIDSENPKVDSKLIIIESVCLHRHNFKAEKIICSFASLFQLDIFYLLNSILSDYDEDKHRFFLAFK